VSDCRSRRIFRRLFCSLFNFRCVLQTTYTALVWRFINPAADISGERYHWRKYFRGSIVVQGKYNRTLRRLGVFPPDFSHYLFIGRY
jgi:hypothetical protein